MQRGRSRRRVAPLELRPARDRARLERWLAAHRRCACHEPPGGSCPRHLGPPWASLLGRLDHRPGRPPGVTSDGPGHMEPIAPHRTDLHRSSLLLIERPRTSPALDSTMDIGGVGWVCSSERRRAGRRRRPRRTRVRRHIRCRSSRRRRHRSKRVPRRGRAGTLCRSWRSPSSRVPPRLTVVPSRPTHAASTEEHPYDRLDCPACGTIFRDLPDARVDCPACGATVDVLTCPEGVRHLLTAADLASFDHDWDALHATRRREEAQRRNAAALEARRAALASYGALGVRLVELRTAPGACPACLAAAGHPFRPRAAPGLPIAGCEHDVCRCEYVPARPSATRR